MAMRHPFLFQQMALFSLLGPDYGTPEMMRRLLFSPDMPVAKLREYFDYVQAESQVVALDMMGLNPLRLKPEQVRMPILALGARNDVFVSPAMVEETARFYRTEVHIFPNMAHAMMTPVDHFHMNHLLLLPRETQLLPATCRHNGSSAHLPAHLPRNPLSTTVLRSRQVNSPDGDDSSLCLLW